MLARREELGIPTLLEEKLFSRVRNTFFLVFPGYCYTLSLLYTKSSSNLGHLSFSHADTATSMETRQEIIPRFLFFAQNDSHLEKKRG